MYLRYVVVHIIIRTASMQASTPRPRVYRLICVLLLLVVALGGQMQPTPMAQAAPPDVPLEGRFQGRDLHAPNGFLTEPAAGDPLDIALSYLRDHTAKLGLTADDLSDIVVQDRYVSQHNGVTH